MASYNRWKKALKKAMDDDIVAPWRKTMEPDHPDCPRCGSTMDFYGHDDDGDFPFGEGYWECNNCGFKISEEEVRT